MLDHQHDMREAVSEMAVATGGLRYELVEGWGKLPESFELGYTHGIEVDHADRVYVLHTKSPNLVVLESDGRFVAGYDVEGIGSGAHGFYLHRESDGTEYLYMTDTNAATVIKTTLQGEVVLRLNPPALPDVYVEGKAYKPTDLAVAPNGDIFVTDGYGQNWIHRYSAAGEYLRSFGGTGKEPGQLKCPHGISVKLTGSEPELYVADRGNNRFQVFTLDGEHKRFVDHNMDKPCSFYLRDGLT
ncbi:MAG: repeat-containing protein, partial [Paenibacillus sp.]|nr:repeat-containing protein [Paenibacillus sp.]